MIVGNKLYSRLVYSLIPVALLFIASYSGNGDKVDQTTPYCDDLPSYLLPIQYPAGNPSTEEGVELGRMLFYDTILSGNQKQSCASCHRQELAFTDGREISIGSQGRKAHRNSLTLVNPGWQDRFFWDGRASSLEELIHFPVTDSLEMNADTLKIEKRLNRDKKYAALFQKAFGKTRITMPLVAKAISQFLRTIVSYRAPFDIISRDYVFNGGDSFKYKNSDDYFLLESMFGAGNEDKYGHEASLAKRIKDISPDTTVFRVFTVCIACHYSSLEIFCLHDCDGKFIPE